MTYEFTVSGGTDRHFKIVGPYIGERSHHSAIIWAADSSSVQFVFDGVEIQVKPQRYGAAWQPMLLAPRD